MLVRYDIFCFDADECIGWFSGSLCVYSPGHINRYYVCLLRGWRLNTFRREQTSGMSYYYIVA